MSNGAAVSLVEEMESSLGTRRGDDHGIFRSFFDWSGMCVANVDQAARIIEANVDFARLFGVPSAELGGSDFYELLHPSVREKIKQQFSRLVAGSRARFTERVIAPRPYDTLVFGGELTAVAVHGAAGQVESIMTLVRPDRSGREPQMVPARRKKLLTDMDARILEGVAAGVSTVQLAGMLYLSRGGVEYHVATLLRKLKVNNRPALVSKAYSMGLLCVGSWPPRVLPEYVK